MASGKAIGEFSFKAITATCSPGPAGSVLNQVNWEGTATGFGAVFSTVTYVGGPKNGTFSECGTAYLDNGDGLNGIGQGPTRVSGNTGGARRALCSFSYGRRICGEGEMNLASRSWKGTLFEMS
jgi:hypothetical protein